MGNFRIFILIFLIIHTATDIVFWIYLFEIGDFSGSSHLISFVIFTPQCNYRFKELLFKKIPFQLSNLTSVIVTERDVSFIRRVTHHQYNGLFYDT